MALRLFFQTVEQKKDIQVWKNIIILLQISGQGEIDLSVGKRRFTEERNLTMENRKRKAAVISTLKNITLLSEK